VALLVAFAFIVWRWDNRTIDHVRITETARPRAIDGDSFRFRRDTVSAEMRLDGIDAPEFEQTCRQANGQGWACGAQAHAALAAILSEPQLTCAVRARDRYQRDVASCGTAQTPDIAAEMVDRGLAVATGRGDVLRYAVEEDRARTANRGLWQGPFQRPADWRAAHPRRSMPE
jgi:endonuclease YncB( thermonuclease family)